MKKIILFGATVNLGKEIAKEAVHRGYTLTVVIRNKNKSSLFHNIPIT
jgi:putative NADH-flavin reductase